MAIADTSTYLSARVALSQSAPATTEQLAALKAELETDPDGRGYKGQDGQYKAVSDLVLLLNDPITRANPTPQGRVTVESIPQAALLVLTTTVQAKRASMMLAQPPQPLPDGIAYIIDTLMPSAASQESLSMSAPGTGPMIAALVGSGVLSQEDADAVTTQPDPAWTPLVDLPSRASAICGVAEAGDIVAALAGG